MGTCLTAAVQQHYEASDELGKRALWETLGIFEFNKDYELSMHLYGLRPELGQLGHDADWPSEAEFGNGCQSFKVEELPGLHAIYNAKELADGWGVRYVALREYCIRLQLELGAERVRVLFWRDQ